MTKKSIIFAVIVPVLAYFSQSFNWWWTQDHPMRSSVAISFICMPFLWGIASLLCSKINYSFPKWPLKITTSISIWLIIVDVVARLTSSLSKGFLIGSVIIAGAGTICLLINSSTSENKLKSNLLKQSFDLIAIAGASTLCLLPTIWLTDFHDKINLGGQSHFSFINQLADNRYYPPFDNTIPEYPRNYHFGIYLPIVLLMTSFKMRVDLATDLLEIFIWGLNSTLFASVAFQIFREKKNALFVGFFAPLAGGYYGIFSKIGVAGVLWLGGQMVLPPFANHFFQMPFSLGTALALSSLVFYNEQLNNNNLNIKNLCGLTLNLCALSLVNSTLFLASTSAIIGACLISKKISKTFKESSKILAKNSEILSATVAIIFFVCCNNLWAVVIGKNAQNISFHLSGFTGKWGTSFLYAFEIFGLMLLIIPMLIFYPDLFKIEKFKKLYFYFLFSCLGSIIVYNIAKYKFTWDIIKFATVAQIYLGLLACIFLSNLVFCKRYSIKIFGIFLTFLLCYTNIVALKKEIPKLYFGKVKRDESFNYQSLYNEYKKQEGLFACVSFFRNHLKKDDVVLCDLDLYEPLALLGVVPLFKPTGWEIALGVPESRINARLKLMNEPSNDITQYYNEGARFILAKRNGDLINKVINWKTYGNIQIVEENGDFVIAKINTKSDL